MRGFLCLRALLSSSLRKGSRLLMESKLNRFTSSLCFSSSLSLTASRLKNESCCCWNRSGFTSALVFFFFFAFFFSFSSRNESSLSLASSALCAANVAFAA